MTFRRSAALSLVPVVLVGGAALACLAGIALQAALGLGRVEGGLMAWLLLFVVGLPLLLPLMALARRRPSRIWERKSHGRDNQSSFPHRGTP